MNIPTINATVRKTLLSRSVLRTVALIVATTIPSFALSQERDDSTALLLPENEVRSQGINDSTTLLLPENEVRSQGINDSTTLLLPEIEVRSQGRSQFRRETGESFILKSEDALRLSHTLGESDMVAQLRLLSGIDRSAGDYSSGLSVDGADPSQTQYLIDGAPVIFPYRFGGVFSTFNTPHFSDVRFSRRSDSSLSPRLGGALEFRSRVDMEDGLSGHVNVGLVSSSATLRAGYKDKGGISLSGRLSYLDRIYGDWLNSDETALDYEFGDFNATAGLKPSGRDYIQISLFHNRDRVGYDDANYSMDTRLNWSNTASSLSWRHDGSLPCEVSVYYSAFSNRLSMSMPQFDLTVPTSRKTIGVAATFQRLAESRTLSPSRWGGRCETDLLVPQRATLRMTGEGAESLRRSPRMRQTAVTALVFGEWTRSLSDRLRGEFSVSGGVYRSVGSGLEAYTSALLSSEMSLDWTGPAGGLSVSLAYRNQPIHSVGLSDIGLASDFFIGAFKGAKVQGSMESRVTWRTPRLPLGLRGEASLHYALLSNQVEYTGQVLELIETDYNPFARLLVADGFNYGGRISISRDFGQVTGSLSYDWMEGRRHDGSQKSWWRSGQSQGHTVKADAVWHLSDKWTLSGDFVMKSGRPYTPVRGLYVIAGNIAMDYGKRNSARLPLYHSLNLSATYSFSTTCPRLKLRHLINLSLINALGHRNVEMQYFFLGASDGSYRLKRLYSLYRFLPSISYALQF